MPRLVVNIDQSLVARRDARDAPRAKIGANWASVRPFYLSPAYVWTMAILTAVATAVLGVAIWRLFHFPH